MITVNARYFGMVAEKTGVDSEQFEIDPKAELLKQFVNRYNELEGITIKIAVNHKFENIEPKDGDEVALLPPFAGG